METTVKKRKSTYNVLQNIIFVIKLSWMENNKKLLLFVIFVALSEVGISLLGLFVAPTILNTIEEGRPLTEFVITILRFVGPLILLRMAITYFNTNAQLGKIDLRMAWMRKIIGKFLTTSYSNTLKEDVQKKIEQSINVINDESSASEAIWVTITTLIQSIIGFIIYLFILTVFDPLIIGVILITTIISFFTNKYITGWGYRHRDEEAAYHKQMNYIIGRTRDITLAKDIRLFGMNSWLEDVYQSGFSLFKNFLTRREKVYIWTDVIDLSFSFLRNGLGYLYLIHLVLNYSLSAATFLLYFTAIGGFTSWVTGILSGFITLNQQSFELSTVRELLEYPEPFLFEEGTPLTPVIDKKYELELRNVTFAYEGSNVNTLEKINLKIAAGEKLAIVGINGAGKTTLIKLLCGFLDPTEGEVLLNGVNIKTYNRRDYYQLFSAVFQDFSLIPGSISYNIAQNEAAIDTNKVAECAKLASIDEDIKSLPNGYETNLVKEVYDDALELSGGQIQRLMLARALYKNGPILVLDEPTAALDPIAESKIYQAYNDLTAGKTAIYISHRLASTRFCDRILLIDGNQIAEAGTHEELLIAGGKYTQMFEIQSQYYQEEITKVGDNHE